MVLFIKLEMRTAQTELFFLRLDPFQLQNFAPSACKSQFLAGGIQQGILKHQYLHKVPDEVLKDISPIYACLAC